MTDQSCLFCKIVAGEESAEKVWENEEFIAIKNKFPMAPTHLLVMPKAILGSRRLPLAEVGGFGVK